MDALVGSTLILVGALGGYLIGLLVRTGFVERDAGGGGGEPPTGPPGGPYSFDDFDLWELEVGAPSGVRV